MDTLRKMILAIVVILVSTASLTGTELRKIYVTDESTGTTANVNTDGQLHVVMGSMVDAGNSTTTVLDPGDVNVFTGTSIDITPYAEVGVNVYSSHASATDGLSVQFSSDDSNWDHLDVFTIAATTGKTFSFQPAAKYFRIVYTNGAVLQTEFRLQTLLHKGYIKSSSHRIADSISGQDDAELVKSVLSGEDPDGVFQNVNTTTDGDLTISDNSSGLAIAKGNVSGTTFIHKFGNAPDYDTGDGFVTIWDGANDGVANAMVYTYSATANITGLSSSAADTVDIEILGLDTSYGVVTQTKTLTGTTAATLDTALIRIFRMKNVGATDLAGTVYCWITGTDVTSTPGVPATAANIRAIITIGHNQTLMAVYTIPAGKTGYMRDWYASTAGAKKTSAHEVHLEARPFGQVFQTKHVSSVIAVGNSYIQHKYEEPEIFAAKTDIEIHANTDEDAASFSAGFDIVLVDD